MSAPRLGVMLFSLGGLFWQRRLSLADGLEAVAALGADQGIELIGAQSLGSYPDVSDEEVRLFRDAVERTGVEPVSYCAYLERARSRSTVLSPVEALALVEEEIGTARRLGFPMVRLNTATPEVLRALAPLAERENVSLVVELATEPRTDPAAAALVEELDRLQCPSLGLVQDFSAFVQRIPAPFLESEVAEGASAEAVDAVARSWAAGEPVGAAVEAVLTIPDLPPSGRGRAVQTAHIAYALFRAGSPEGLHDVLPHLRHVQAKCFALEPDGTEPCIPYELLIPALRDLGFEGRIHTEFEGFLWSDSLDALDQIARSQAYITRLWQQTH